MQGLVGSHREAYDEMNVPIKVKNKFVNFLFENCELQQVTFRKTIVCFSIFFIIFLGLSIFLYVQVSKVQEIKQLYYDPQFNTCPLQNLCEVSLTIPQDMQAPVHLMYYLTNFYQNQRRYIQSKNNYQLAGNNISEIEARSCFPYIYNQDLGKTKSWDGSTTLNSNAIASPCGTIAYSFPYFNDQFKLYYSNGTEIYISQTGISWQGDKGQAYRRSPDSTKTQWLDVEDEHFIVWMRTSGLPNFRKPWGRIDQNLSAGTYKITVSNSNNVTGWGDKRGFILTTTSLVGGRNFLLPTSFLIIAILNGVATVFFCLRFRALRDIGKLKS